MSPRTGRQSRIAPKTALLRAIRAFREEIEGFIKEYKDTTGPFGKVAAVYVDAFAELREQILPLLKHHLGELGDQIFIRPSELAEEQARQIQDGTRSIEIVGLVTKIEHLFEKQQTMRPKFSSSLPSYGRNNGGNIHKWATLAEDNREVLRDIDSLIAWFGLSDLDVMRDRFSMITQRIDNILLHPIKILKQKNLTYAQPLKDSIPVINLCRVFFSNIDELGPRHPFFLISSSDQVAFIEQATCIPDNLKSFVYDIVYDEPPCSPEDCGLGYILIDEFVEASKRLQNSFDKLLRTDHPQLDHHLTIIEDYRIWYDEWFAGLDSSVENFYSTYKALFPMNFGIRPNHLSA
ncbi:hypothetical protein PSTT_11337 [Puccinia striiformis]|uniref:Uncharacterized protein n=1 Tax=Puccinia striiformis TaxID=27350 RepID=A0A2S4V0V8_9BASI|nr:hypothetical protein PSTT_11337 [Puccinia striiformis]